MVFPSRAAECAGERTGKRRDWSLALRTQCVVGLGNSQMELNWKEELSVCM